MYPAKSNDMGALRLAIAIWVLGWGFVGTAEAQARGRAHDVVLAGIGAKAAQANTTLVGLTFIPVTPCRVADTRLAKGPLGGPMLPANSTRDFQIPASSCNIPYGMAAYSLNVTVVPQDGLGFLATWPTGQTQPVVSTLNSDGRIKANAAIVAAGTNSSVTVYVSDTSHVILDINGYFVPETTEQALEFYPIAPCRVADTRNANGSLGGPFLAGGATRTFPTRASSCNIPSNAQAYSLNMTVVPHRAIGFLATWPAGQTQPPVSTLNTSSLEITANAAIVSAGAGGGIDVYSSDDTDLVIDTNGYFAPYGTGGLELYTVTPCRLLDTRLSRLSDPTPLNGSMAVATMGGSCGIPANAEGLALNVTVVPQPSVGFLSLWPDGTTRPLVSTLNAFDGAITSNMAIVPTNDSAVDVYSSSATHVILDTSGYFAPGAAQASAGITASPTIVALGGSTTLSWTSVNVSSCIGSGSWSGTLGVSGNQSITPASTGSFSYTLTCSGTGGSVSMSTTVTVIAAPALAVSVAGNHLVDNSGKSLQLRGVNVSGLEATAIQGWAVESGGGYNVWGDAGLGEEPPWQKIHNTWYSNAVRLPLNEASWLGYTCSNVDGTTQNPDPGANYQAKVQQSVTDANAAGLYVILDLHWSAPKVTVNGVTVDLCPKAQNSMADADHSLAFWTSVANTFKNNQGVIFELFNEPFFYWLQSGENQWSVLQNGGTITEYVTDTSNVTYNWTATGTQQMMNAVRATGAKNVVLVSGVNWNGDLSQLESHMPFDSGGQTAVAWHPYPSSSAPTQPSNGVIQYTYAQQIAATYPVICTETGDHDTTGTIGAPFVSILLPWADAQGISYLGWTWDPWSNPDDVLIKDASGTPTDGYGQYFQNHLTCRAQGNATCP
jgi:hypothetical protein